MRYTILSVLAAAASTVSAWTTQGNGPLGNAIFTPGNNTQVPAGTPFNITWDPTTSGTVTIVLQRGPPKNLTALYPIVEKTPNNGHYIWTPATDLQPDTTGYSLLLIDDANGQFQYSNQWGISNNAYVSSSTQTSSTMSSTMTTSNTASSPAGSTSTSASSKSTTDSTVTSSTITSYQTTLSYSTTTTSKFTSSVPATTSSVPTLVTSSKPSSTVAPSKPATTTTSTGAPQQTGAASANGVKAGLSIAMALVGVVALTL